MECYVFVGKTFLTYQGSHPIVLFLWKNHFAHFQYSALGKQGPARSYLFTWLWWKEIDTDSKQLSVQVPADFVNVPFLFCFLFLEHSFLIYVIKGLVDLTEQACEYLSGLKKMLLLSVSTQCLAKQSKEWLMGWEKSMAAQLYMAWRSRTNKKKASCALLKYKVLCILSQRRLHRSIHLNLCFKVDSFTRFVHSP